MTVKKRMTENDKNVYIEIEGRFDFSLHQDFRDIYTGETGKSALYTLDLSRATYMDSSALGMILLLKDHAEKLAGTIEIINANESVSKILEIAQFHKLMSIK